MPDSLKPYFDLAYDAGLALTDASYAYSLLIAAAPMLTIAGLIVLVGLIATHGKSHGTRFSAMTIFACAALAGAVAWLIRPDVAAGTMLGTLLAWAWLPPMLAGLALFTTMPKKPKPRAFGLAGAMLVALCATLFGGMLAVANERATDPDGTAWLDAPTRVKAEHQPEAKDEREDVVVLDTAAHR